MTCEVCQRDFEPGDDDFELCNSDENCSCCDECLEKIWVKQMGRGFDYLA